MKQIIKLGLQQSAIMKEILKDQYQYYPKKASKFTIKTESDSNGCDEYVMYCDGRLDTEYFGQLMYILGMKIKY